MAIYGFPLLYKDTINDGILTKSLLVAERLSEIRILGTKSFLKHTKIIKISPVAWPMFLVTTKLPMCKMKSMEFIRIFYLFSLDFKKPSVNPVITFN